MCLGCPISSNGVQKTKFSQGKDLNLPEEQTELPMADHAGFPTARDHAPVTSMRLDSWIHWWVRVGDLA